MGQPEPRLIKIVTVVGTRPEAIKLAPVLRELGRYPQEISVILCVTGQHREMLDQVLHTFDLRPDIDLELMQPDQSLADLTARVLIEMGRVLEAERPDLVLVQGDTTTTLATALAAHYHRVPVGHVEAGLRTGDRFSPFPEEMNRRLATALSTYHFAPTAAAVAALAREGVPSEQVFQCGNTVVDALHWILERNRREGVSDLMHVLGEPVAARLAAGARMVLVTAHRRENFGEPLRRICEALLVLAERHSDVLFVYPVHRNPNVRAAVHDAIRDHPRILLPEPVPYDVFVELMDRAFVILTDSGGVQEEGPALGKPVLVLREQTERPEGIAAGVARLVGTSRDAIVEECDRLLTDAEAYREMARPLSPYGDGRSAGRIVDVIRGLAIARGSHVSR